MKNILDYIINNKYKKIIYVGLILLAILLVILLFSLIFGNKEEKILKDLDEKNKNIVVSKTKKEKPGTLIRNLDSLRKEHCKDDICVKNVIVYYIKNQGRIEYEITNNSKKKVTGAFKIKFDNGKSSYIIFNKLKKNETRQGVISFTDLDLSNIYDYSLTRLKDDEFKKLVNSKK